MEHVNTALYGTAAVISTGWVTKLDETAVQVQVDIKVAHKIMHNKLHGLKSTHTSK